MKYLKAGNIRLFWVTTFVYLFLIFNSLQFLQASDSHAAAQGGEIDVAGIMIHHVTDTHDWHFFDLPGEGHYEAISIDLPWLIYDNRTGISFYPTTEDLLHSGKYILEHGKVAAISFEVTSINQLAHHVEEDFKNAGGKNIELDSLYWVNLFAREHYVLVQDHNPNFPPRLYKLDMESTVLDLSLTKTSLQMVLVGFAMILVFISVAGYYSRRKGQGPKGLQSFVEPVIVFIRDQIAIPHLGEKKYARFLPYLLTLFFFIWFSNLFGLTPLNSNIAGNISVTLALAILTFIITLFSASRSFWGHVFWFPGVPLPVKFLMMPVEIVGMFTKPFALTVRLFANIAAGHLMLLALIGLIFILGKGGQSVVGGLSISPLTLAFGLFIYCLEFLVAVVQAYVFTLLTAVFIGQAMADHSHDHAEDHSSTDHALAGGGHH